MEVLGDVLDADTEAHAKLTVFIPVAQKDYDMLPYTISSIMKYVKDPIEQIVISGAYNQALVDFCSKYGFKYLDENNIFNSQEFWGLYQEVSSQECNKQYNAGPGWYYQQLLKYKFSTHSQSENYLVMDSDVIFTRPFQAVVNGVHQFYVRERGYGMDWGECYIKKIMDVDTALPHSFIFDMMVFNKKNVLNLMDVIEHGSQDKFEKAILKFDQYQECRFSEFETYGVYVNHTKSLEINITMLDYQYRCRKNIDEDLKNQTLMSQNGLIAYHRWIC